MTQTTSIDSTSNEDPLPTNDIHASEAIVLELAETLNVDPLDISPLANTIDPDAIDRLFGSTGNGTPRRGGRVEFVHDGCTVVVRFDGEIDVTATRQ